MKLILSILILKMFLFADDGLLKEKLHDTILRTLPEAMCKEKVIFTQCFFVNIQECKILVKKSITPCFKKFENRINNNMSREQFINIGNNIGQCVGAKYFKSLKRERKVDAKCFNSLK